MNNLEKLKEQIEKNTIDHSVKIFVCSDDFLPRQYIHEISRLQNLPVEQASSIEELSKESFDIFSTPVRTLRVIFQEELSELPENLLNLEDIIIVVKKCSVTSDKVFKFPKLESWMLTDYAYSLAEGVEKKKLDCLVDLCENNIYRLDSELSKLKIFDKTQQDDAYQLFLSEGMFDDLSKDTIFTLSNAIMTRDTETVGRVYKNIHNIDVEPIGLLTVLYNNIKSVIQVQLNPSATAQSCGLSDKHFYAIKKYTCGYYTKDELLHMFDIISSLDKRIKAGEFPVDILIDYLIVNTLGVSV